MAGRVVPSWPATIGAGLLAGLAVATRSSGIITQIYLIAATGLCALEALVRPGGTMRGDLLRIGARAACALAIGWIAAIAILISFTFMILHYRDPKDEQNVLATARCLIG